MKPILAALAASMLLASLPACAAVSPQGGPVPTARSIMFLQALRSMGIAPGVQVELGGAVYQIEDVEVAFDRASKPSLTIKLKRVR